MSSPPAPDASPGLPGGERLFGPRTMALLHAVAPGLPPPLWERVVAPTRAALTAPGVRTHASLARELARWAGLPPDDVDTCTDLLDLLQLAIDVADNVGDWVDDLAQGRAPHVRYDGLNPPLLACVPPLVVGGVIHVLHTRFAAPRTGAEAAGRLLETLSRMSSGQGEADASEGKVEAVSTTQGLLLCLPLWTRLDDTGLRDALPAVEDWTRRFARTWEWDALARERVPGARERLASSRQELRRHWPTFGPFAPGQPLSKDALLGIGVT